MPKTRRVTAAAAKKAPVLGVRTRSSSTRCLRPRRKLVTNFLTATSGPVSSKDTGRKPSKKKPDVRSTNSAKQSQASRTTTAFAPASHQSLASQTVKTALASENTERATSQESSNTTAVPPTIRSMQLDELLEAVGHRVRQEMQVINGVIPEHWGKMPADSSVCVIDVECNSKEYTSVLASFEKTMVKSMSASGSSKETYSSIIKIQRIQNLTLYSQYLAKKKEMDRSNGSEKQNEMMLFHGTTASNSLKINQQGFNRKFCGRNNTAHGKGCYFARDACYSASDMYSPPDASGYKYVYLARVLTGKYTDGGHFDLLSPPPKDPSNPALLYDSVVDNKLNPGIFVTFHDSSNYPEYLIVFTR